MTSYALRVTDINGRTTDYKLPAQTRAKAWEAYTELWGNHAATRIDLIEDGAVIDRTEHKLIGTPDAYRMSGSLSWWRADRC